MKVLGRMSMSSFSIKTCIMHACYPPSLLGTDLWYLMPESHLGVSMLASMCINKSIFEHRQFGFGDYAKQRPKSCLQAPRAQIASHKLKCLDVRPTHITLISTQIPNCPTNWNQTNLFPTEVLLPRIAAYRPLSSRPLVARSHTSQHPKPHSN